MFWTILALLSLIILGGFISYYGDLQGRRWGKRRVSWFGLRPKHTAILITSLTGAFISLLSVVTLLLISPTVREVVLRGEHAIRDYERIKAQYDEDLRNYKLAMADAQNKQVALKRQNNALTQQKQQTQKQYEIASAKLEPLQKHVAALNLEVRWESGQVIGLKKIEQKLRSDNTALGEQKLQLARSKNLLAKSKAVLTTQNRMLQTENTHLTTENKQLAHENAALMPTNQVLMNSNQDLTRQNQELERKNGELQQRDSLLQAQIDEKQKEVNEAYSNLVGSGQSFAKIYYAMRQNKISVRAGSELARRTLDAHMRPEAVRRELRQLLQDASDNAVRYGAVTGSNGRAVRIVSKLVLTLAGAQDVNEEDSLNVLVDNIQGSNRPVVVVVNAVSNALEGEQVMIELSLHEVDPIFKPGQVLASQHIDGNQPEDQVQQTIARFLQTGVRAVAIKAGTIPQVDPATGVSQIGTFDPLDIARLTEQTRRLRGDVVVQAVAIAPITSADTLNRQNLRLDVLRAQ